MRRFPLLSSSFLLLVLPVGGWAAEAIQFSREVRPILSENCYACHGPDEKKREAKLRLDDETSAKSAHKGVTAIVPGHPEQSAIIERIESKDPEEVMPPPKLHKTLSGAQLATLKEWIKQGAKWGRHWSYETVVRPTVPVLKEEAGNGAGAKEEGNAIDAFLAQRLQREGLRFSPAAEAGTIVRRLALDLTGLPPTLDELNRFASTSPFQLSTVIQHYLNKPGYGEHWARLWLDLARYADSSGYPSDQPREIWAYRDWVVRALNANMPFDQFTIEQLAGDLMGNWKKRTLPPPLLTKPSEFDPPSVRMAGGWVPQTEDDLLTATAFHRNTMTQNEGGTSDEEFRNAAIIDRVNTTMAVWMGTSMACAQCHTHKYDPITNKEYFQFFAILNQSADADKKDESPVHEFLTPEIKRQREAAQSELAAIEAKLAKPDASMLAGLEAWATGYGRELAWQHPKPLSVTAKSKLASNVNADGVVAFAKTADTDTHTLEIPVSGDKLTALRLETIPANGHGNFVVSGLKAQLIPPSGKGAPGVRYVRIELPGKAKFLQLAEVQVFSNGTNVALKGSAKQSSQYTTAEAKLAIDGKTEGDYQKGSVAHTNQEDNPWWEVDLGSVSPVERLVIWNRTDGATGSRLEGFRVIALDEKRGTVWQSEPLPAPKVEKELVLGGASTVEFSKALADFEQSGFAAESLLKPNDKKSKGWAVGGSLDKPHTLTLLAKAPVTVPAGSVLRVTIEQNSEFKQHTLGSYRLSFTNDVRAAQLVQLPAPVLAALTLPKAKRNLEQSKTVADYYLRNIAKETAPDRRRMEALKKEVAALKPNTVPIMKDLTGKDRRVTRVQLRGNWQALDEVVTEGTPAAFPSIPAGFPANRLGLAKWLVDHKNPLTARVMMNRLWDNLFGVGIVRTSEEFGSQGELPVHPDLLDWLAAEFMDSGWDLKHMLTLMVGSRAYRQSSKVTPDLQDRDPDNRLLARGPRFRPPGELLRDQSLAVSGLLSPKMFGAPVRPMSPSLGLSTAFGRGNDWTTSDGEDKHRRSLYTEVRRNAPYASFMTFDATNREVCTLRRGRTNTPLQAFVTLNDPVFIECAQGLARRMMQEGGATTDQRLQWAFKACLSRAATPVELKRLTELFNETRSSFAKDLPQAAKLATDPIGPAPKDLPVADLAAWTTVANVIMNLDEFVMRK